VKTIVRAVLAVLICYTGYTSDQIEEYKEAQRLIELGRRAEAKNILKDLSNKNSQWGIVHLEYAINCIYLECPDKEIEEYLSKAEALLKDNPRLYYYRGLFMEHLNKETALKFYNKAISLRPSYTDALIRACSLYIEKGDYQSAISYYDSIPDTMKSSTLVLRMVDLLVEHKDYQRAEKELIALTKLHPDNEMYLTKLRDFYSLTGKNNRAKDVDRRINSLSPRKKRYMRPLR
jgi:tetratricopeptide (TPR) repeat protein